MQIDEDTDTYSLHLEFVKRGGFIPPRTKSRLSKIVGELLTEIHKDEAKHKHHQGKDKHMCGRCKFFLSRVDINGQVCYLECARGNSLRPNGCDDWIAKEANNETAN